ncbi:MAG: NAD(P)/FAD-dependent oxidoreductase, partial [Candidatus Methylomirabilales bacterium]
MRATADVVVVGGGIIGCAVAAELARAGAEVVALEQGGIASAASGRNHGLIFYPQNPVTAPLYSVSLEIYREMAEASEIDVGLDQRPRGFVIVVAEEQEWAAAQAEAEASAGGEVEIERLDSDALMAAEPNLAPGHLGGYFIGDGYRLDPAALTLVLALEARRAGAEIVTHCEVKQVLVSKGRVRGIASDLGVVSTEVVVDAAGPWAPKLARSAGADLPIAGARGWLLLTRAIDPITNHLVESSGWHLPAGEAGPGEVILGSYAEGRPSPPDVGLIVQQNRSGHV